MQVVGVHVTEVVGERAVVRQGLLAAMRQAVEVAQGRRRVELKAQRPARPQTQEEQEHAHPEQERTFVLHEGLEPTVGHVRRPPGQLGEEVGDGSGQDRSQGQDRFLPRA